MDLVGKIFVGIIAAFGVVLFALAFVILAKHEDWRLDSLASKQKIEEINKDVQELNTIKTDLTAVLNNNKKAHAPVVAALQKQTKDLETKNSQLRVAFLKFESDLQKQIESISANNVSINEYRSMIDLLTRDTKNSQVSRSAYLRDLAKTVALKYEQGSILQNFEEENKDLLKKYGNAKEVLAKFGLEANPELYGKIPQFVVRGIVEQPPKNGSNKILISIGSSDGLEPGHFLEVYHENTYLGRIMVETVEANRSVCSILPAYRQGPIQAGDIATSKFMYFSWPWR
ncbi:MAG: hypothetical protein Q4G69_03490 [Planctomycetia bacterium]|nr:hypothetical protein [Planctomycetia bacterium]